MSEDIKFTGHARKRMEEYDIGEDQVLKALDDPDDVVEGHSGRLIAHSRLNGKILRVVFESMESVKTIVTVYKARAERYGV